MLFKAFGVQFLLGTIFLFIPIIVYLSTFVLQLQNTVKITTLCTNVGMYYGIFETLSMTYFITPYRNTVKNLFWKSRRKGSLVISYVSRTNE